MTVRKVTDFTVGDRIVAATYEISYLQDDGSQTTSSPTCSATSICRKTATIARCASGSRTMKTTSRHGSMCTTEPIPKTSTRIEVLGHHQLQFTIAVT